MHELYGEPDILSKKSEHEKNIHTPSLTAYQCTSTLIHMEKKSGNQYKKELVGVICDASRSSDALDAFLEDILAPKEYKDIAMRLQIVKQLKEGRPHRDIAEDLGVGVATIERGARMLKNESGGFNRVL